jgi:hypothetical protein
MRTLAGAALVSILCLSGPLLAQGSPTPGPMASSPALSADKTIPTPDFLSTPTPAAALTVAAPQWLEPKDLLDDGTGWKGPWPPKKDADGTRVHLENDTDHCPRGDRMGILASSDAVTLLQGFGKSDPSSKHIWHKIGELSFCHFRDGDRDWYGWRTGDTFQWVLWRGGRFWWHDTYAGRWLSSYNGNWWWQSRKPKDSIQVYLENGHYYLCSKDGTLGDDLWTTGVVESANKPVEKVVTPAGERDDKGLRKGGIGGSQMGD